MVTPTKYTLLLLLISVSFSICQRSAAISTWFYNTAEGRSVELDGPGPSPGTPDLTSCTLASGPGAPAVQDIYYNSTNKVAVLAGAYVEFENGFLSSVYALHPTLNSAVYYNTTQSVPLDGSANTLFSNGFLIRGKLKTSYTASYAAGTSPTRTAHFLGGTHIEFENLYVKKGHLHTNASLFTGVPWLYGTLQSAPFKGGADHDVTFENGWAVQGWLSTNKDFVVGGQDPTTITVAADSEVIFENEFLRETEGMIGTETIAYSPTDWTGVAQKATVKGFVQFDPWLWHTIETATLDGNQTLRYGVSSRTVTLSSDTTVLFDSWNGMVKKGTLSGSQSLVYNDALTGVMFMGGYEAEFDVDNSVVSRGFLLNDTDLYYSIASSRTARIKAGGAYPVTFAFDNTEGECLLKRGTSSMPQTLTKASGTQSVNLYDLLNFNGGYFTP